MKLSNCLSLGAAAAVLALASQAGAQTPAKPATPAAKPAAPPPAAPAAAPAAAAPAAPAPLQITTPVPGVCTLSRESLVQNSTVGAYVTDRMKQLSAVVQAELTGTQTTLQTDAKTLDGQKATLQTDVYNQRAQALQVRLNGLQQLAQQRDRELQATEQKAVARILQSAGPLVGQIVVQRGCGILLDANAVLIGNPTLDVTPAVIQGLNGTLTQFAFDREHIDPNAPPAQ